MNVCAFVGYTNIKVWIHRRIHTFYLLSACSAAYTFVEHLIEVFKLLGIVALHI